MEPAISTLRPQDAVYDETGNEKEPWNTSVHSHGERTEDGMTSVGPSFMWGSCAVKVGSKYDQGHTVFMANSHMEIYKRHGHNYGIYFTVPMPWIGVATLPIP